MPLTEHARANSDRISAIAMEVQSLLKQAEKEGEDGLVDQAQATMSKVSMNGCRYVTRIAHFICKLLFIWHLSADMLKETLSVSWFHSVMHMKGQMPLVLITDH